MGYGGITTEDTETTERVILQSSAFVISVLSVVLIHAPDARLRFLLWGLAVYRIWFVLRRR